MNLIKKISRLDTKTRTYVISGIVLLIIWLLFLFFLIHYYWCEAHANPWGEELTTFQRALNHMMASPFEITPFPGQAVSMAFVWALLFGMFIFMAVLKAKNMRHEDRDKVAGDAQHMTKAQMAQFHRDFSEPFGSPTMEGRNNMLLSNNMGISMASQRQIKKNMNLNALIIGGSGVGKSFRVIAPNIMQRNASYVITDPSGGLYHKYGSFLEYYGYRVKVFNTDRMNESNHYNPFRYIHSDKDIEILVTMIITNTTSPESGKGDQFWEKCETALFCSLIGYLHHYGEAEQQNFSNVMRLIRAANVDENDSSMESPSDKMFAYEKMHDPDSFTMTQYETFRLGAGKTLKSILISAAVRLQAFDLDTVRELTDTDDIHLDTIADEKTALFIVVPTGEKTFNFLAGLMYSQLFNQLYRYCENTSKFTQCIVDSETDEVIKVFHADDQRGVEKAKEQAKEWIDLLDDARVVHMDKMSIRDDKEDGSKPDEKPNHLEFWGIFNAKNQLIGYRGTEEMAKAALESMRHAKIQGNHKRFNHGESCPVHVSFLLDEFANTGKIPSFTEKISTMRKYEISVVIILQSIKQIENLFEKEWDVITANCDTLVYLGGGADTKTTEWLNKLLGKKTVRAMNESFSRNGGSSSIQSQGIDLMSMSQMRTMPNQKCIVLPRGQNSVYDDMYDTPHHPDWGIAQHMPNYRFSAYRQQVIRAGFGEDDALSGGTGGDDISEHGSIPVEGPDDKAVRDNRNAESEKAEREIRSDFDELTESPAITDITTVDPLEDAALAADALGLTQEAEKNLGASGEQYVSSDDILLGFDMGGDDMDFDFDEAPMG